MSCGRPIAVNRPLRRSGKRRGIPFRKESQASFVVALEDGAVIGDEDGEQAGRLGCARVLADEVFAAGRFEEALASLIHLRRASCRRLGSDLARKHVSIDAARVMMLPGLSARSIG